ncbi:hypothetical protein [Methylibium sp.]|uniref:hypothetical protein n=1 Tax=Methylibium sp. TaxID=2067992 RepID=UPI0018558183|nr:hypothetical protein [Methylibium sp.]MBA3590477.1 hypothetical protein [Methylibium sp.]
MMTALAASYGNGAALGGGAAPAGGGGGAGAAGALGGLASANPYSQVAGQALGALSSITASGAMPADTLTTSGSAKSYQGLIGTTVGGGDIQTGGGNSKSASPTLIIVGAALLAVGVIAFVALRR